MANRFERDYKNYIADLKEKWIDKKVVLIEDNAEYTVVDVDYNGMLLINKPSQFTATTAVNAWMVRYVEQEN